MLLLEATKAIWSKIRESTKYESRNVSLQSIHKPAMPLRPIVSGVGSMTQKAAAVLAEL
jgi:hypothetical protein